MFDDVILRDGRFLTDANTGEQRTKKLNRDKSILNEAKSHELTNDNDLS